MNPQKLAVGIILIVVVSAFTLAFLYGDMNKNHSLNTDEVAGNLQTDASWVRSLNQMLSKTVPYPNGTESSNPNVLLSYCRTYLYENGSSELLEFGDAHNNSTNPISTTLNGFLVKANVQLNGSLTSQFVSNVLANDKVVAIVYRYSTLQFGGQQRFYIGYFVLQDNLNQGLAGTIITLDVNQTYSLWAIPK